MTKFNTYFSVPENDKRKNFFFFALIIAMASALRIYHLGTYSFWYDEAIAMLNAQGIGKLPSLAKLFDRDFMAANHDFLVLYIRGFLSYWQNLFGRGEFSMRLSSVIFSGLSIYCLYRLARYMFNITIARVAAFLLALSPFHIFYAQELKPYAAVGLFSLIALYSFLKILEGGGRKHYYIFIAANVLNIYFLYINLFVLFSFGAFLAFRLGRHRGIVKQFLFANAAILILIAPVLLNAYPNLVFVLSNKVSPAFSEFPIWAGERVAPVQLMYTLKNFITGYNVDFYSTIGRLAAALGIMGFGIGAFKFRANERVQAALFFVLVPVLSIFTLSMTKSFYADRYLFGVFPVYLLVVAAGLSQVHWRSAALAAMVLLMSFGLNTYYHNYLPGNYGQHNGEGEKQDVRGLTRSLVARYRDGDRIVHACKNTVFPLKFYARRIGGNPGLVREADEGIVIFISEQGGLSTLHYSQLHASPSIRPQDYRVARKDLEGKTRIWLVFSDFVFPKPDSGRYRIIDMVKQGFKKTECVKFNGAYLYLFSKEE